jgi:hypothetical protein
MTVRWQQYLDGTKGQATPVEWALNRKGVGLPDASSSSPTPPVS